MTGRCAFVQPKVREVHPRTWNSGTRELWSRGRRVWLAFFLVIILAAAAVAQPDPRQMSGLPLPSPELADGTITVRVVRGSLANNVANHPVELHQGDSVVTADTAADGRATFLTLNPGTQVHAVTELDGQRIESQRFAIPGRGGVRVMLVGAAAGDPAAPAVPAQPGQVTFGSDSRIVVELGEETVEVYYIFDVVNAGDTPVEPREPIVFDIPSGAVSTSVLQDSSPRTAVDGPQLVLPGPFPPGVTPLRVAYILPYDTGAVAVSQRVPADLEAFLLMVQKWGAMDVASDLITRRMEDSIGDATYIFAAGPRVVAGNTFTFELTGLPHRSRVPVNLTLALALVILAVGAWGAAAPAKTHKTAARRRSLEARKEKLLADLVKIEKQHEASKIGATKHETRRRELFAALERIYRERDEELVPVVLSSSRPVRKSTPVTGPSGTGG